VVSTQRVTIEMKAATGDIPSSIKLSEEWVRGSPNLPSGLDFGESPALARGNGLETEAGDLYQHVKIGNEVADIYYISIGYFSDKA